MSSVCAGRIGRNSVAFARFLAMPTVVALVALLGPWPGTVAQELTSVRISLDYRLYGPNAAFWYAQSSGIFRDAGITATVDNSSGSGDAVARVASGAYDAGYADLGTLTEFWSKNPNVAPKLVMPILDRAAQSVGKNIVTSATRAGGLGTIDMSKLNNGLKIVAAGFELAKVPTAADVYDDRFLPPIEHRRFREN
jgi:hypothetical protein